MQTLLTLDMGTPPTSDMRTTPDIYIYIDTSIPVFEVAPYACTMRRLLEESAPGCATRLSAYLRNVLGESIACARKLIEKLGVFV